MEIKLVIIKIIIIMMINKEKNRFEMFPDFTLPSKDTA